MLIELYGENFGCFRDEFSLSMLATDIDPGSCRGVVHVDIEGDDEPLRLLRAVAIYGPNASGKSTVLRAANALRYLLEESAQFRSDQRILPYEPFVLNTSHRTVPASLGVRGVVDGKVYDYFFRYDEERIVEESLIRKSADGETELFKRTGQEVEGPWKEDPQFGLLSESFRPNALLLSLADALSPKLAGGIAVGLRRLLRFYDPTRVMSWWRRKDPVADRVVTDPEFAEWLKRRLSDVDIGVVGYKTEIVERSDRGEGDEDDGADTKSYRMNLLHGTANGPVPLPPARESTGTRRFLDLTPYFFDLAHSTKPFAFFVDELDASLHPTLLDGLIRHFNCELDDANVHGQLIFATHETSIIDHEARDALLRRDQVYFTEKNADGAARLYSVVEFKERNNVNMRRRYLQGRYGGLPSLGEFAEE